MAITSPFKRGGHSRNSSATSTNLSNASTSLSSLAAQYEQDKNRLIKYCFSKHDPQGNIIESYITHVRITEDEHYPSQMPPPGVSRSSKKNRVLSLAVKQDGTVFLHKGREASNGTFQIGRSWSLEELTLIKKETRSDTGFILTLGKDYYWETNTSKERQVFIASLVRIYRKFKNGLVPELVNWDLSLFGLDEENYNLFLNKQLSKRKQSVAVVESSKKRESSDTGVPVSKRSTAGLSQESVPGVSPTKLPLQKRPSVTHQVRPMVDLEPSQMGPRMDSKRPAPLNLSQKVQPNFKVQTQKEIRNPSNPPALSPSAKIIPGAALAAANVAAAAAATAEAPPKSDIIPATKKVANASEPSTRTPRATTERSSLDPRSSQTSIPVNIKSEVLPSEDSNVNAQSDLEAKLSQLEIDDTPTPESFTGPPNESDSSHSLPKSIAQSMKGIEILGRTRSRHEFELDEEKEDGSEVSADITELYFNDSSAAQTPNKEKLSGDNEVFPSEVNESRDFSFDYSYENQSMDKLMVASDRIQSNVRSDDEIDDVYDLALPQTPKLDIRPRAGTIDSYDTTAIAPGINDSSVVDIFDSLNWEANDDSDTLIQKLYQELSETQYSSVKNIAELKQHSRTLQNFSSKVIAECDHISPLLSYFQIELAGFAKNVQHVESSHEGIQVEMMNKKNLWSQLRTILNTVSVDEDSLRKLLFANIDSDIAEIERILGDLQSAILEINGSAINTNKEDLGDMKALKDRQSKYESVIIKFLQKIVADLDKRFKLTFGELLKIREFDPKMISKALSKLMAYSTLVLFAKEVSDETFDRLIGIWEGSANSFYEQLLKDLNSSILIASSQSDRFSLISQTAFKDRPVLAETETKINSQQDKLMKKLGVLEDEIEVNQGQLKPINTDTKLIFDTFDILQKHITSQQNFILSFFHVCNDDISVKEYTSKYPLSLRVLNYDTPYDVESEREGARELFESISSIFEPSFDSLIKTLVQSLRHNQKNTPTVMLYLELFEKRYNSSNQEYLLNEFKILGDRLKADWLRYLDLEVKAIEKTSLAPKKSREVSIIIKNFTRLVGDIEENYANTLAAFGDHRMTDTETRNLINSSYYQLSSSIINNLKRDEELKSSAFTNEISANQEKQNYLVNLIQNCNWMVESATMGRVPQLSKCITTAKSMYNSSKELYVQGMLSEYFGKLAVFVGDVKDLMDELNVDPSKRSAFTKDALEKILSGYNTREINKIVSQLRQSVLKHFGDAHQSPIQRQLIDKIWSALQASFVSTTLDLETIISRYYRDSEVQFSKKDVIAAFNSARI